MTIIERLRKHCEWRGDCWIWTASLDTKGYGQINIAKRTRRVHRVAYEQFVGPIPEGMDIDHVKARGCTSRACANPKHLEPVSRRENLLRGDTLTAKQAAQTHCVQGHPFSSDNLFFSYHLGQKRRRCRECSRIRMRKAAA